MRRFRRSESVPRKGPVSATMSIDAESARPRWVSVPPLSSVTQRREVEGEDGRGEDGVGEVVEGPGAGGEEGARVAGGHGG